jgi:hypothetical protein
MNKFSTLFASLCSLLITSSATAQLTQSFNDPVEVAALPSNCWTLNGFSYSNNDLSNGTGSLIAPLSDLPSFTTPLLNSPGSMLTVTLTYRVISSKPGINAIKVDALPGGTGVGVNLGKKNVNTNGIQTETFTLAARNVPATFTIEVEASNISVEIDDLTINANLTLGGCTPTPISLPVKLINFQGSINNNKGQLKWAVADNETGDHFQVMRSTDGKNFTEAGTVFINGKVGAESYSFSDALELAATTFYQLKIVNKNGSIAYSNIITLKSAAAKQAASLTILQNPVAATLSFSYAATSAGKTNLSIYTTSGVKVYSNRISSVKGTNAVSLPLDRHIAPGTYILEVSNGTERNVAKMVKQ